MARREPCTASLSASTSSLSANLAGKVGLLLILLMGADRSQAGLAVQCSYIQKLRWNYLCVITKLQDVCQRVSLAFLCGYSFRGHRNTDVIICFSHCITSVCAFPSLWMCGTYFAYSIYSPLPSLHLPSVYHSILFLRFPTVFLSFFFFFPPQGIGLSSLTGVINSTWLSAPWHSQHSSYHIRKLLC